MIHINEPTNQTNRLIDDAVSLDIDLRDFYPSVEWDVMAVQAERNEKYYLCCAEPYPEIKFNITIRRKTLFYTINLIIPCIGISFLTVFAFYLPSESGEKVRIRGSLVSVDWIRFFFNIFKIALSVSILLSLTVFFLLLSELIPPTSLVVPLICKYLLFTMIMVTLSILVSVIVLNVHFRTSKTYHLSSKSWTRRIFMSILPRILFIKSYTPAKSNDPTPIYDERSHTDDLLNPCFRHVQVNNAVWLDKKKSSKKRKAQRLTAMIFEVVESIYILSQRLNEEVDEIKVQIFSHTAISATLKFKYFSPFFPNKINEEWKYIGSVIDRVFLCIFTLACVLGTATIIFVAPSLYDQKPAIDFTTSKRFNKF